MSCRTLGPASPPWPWCKGCPQKSHCCRPALLRPFSTRLLALTLTFSHLKDWNWHISSLSKITKMTRMNTNMLMMLKVWCGPRGCVQDYFAFRTCQRGASCLNVRDWQWLLRWEIWSLWKQPYTGQTSFDWFIERKAKLSLRKQLKSYQSKSTTVIKIAMNSNDVKLKTLTKILRWSEFCPARLLSSPHSSSFEFKDWKTFQRNLIWIKYSHVTICTLQIHNRA